MLPYNFITLQIKNANINYRGGHNIFGNYHFDVQYSEIQKVNIQILTSQYLVKISNKIYNNILNYSCILQYKLK